MGRLGGVVTAIVTGLLVAVVGPAWSADEILAYYDVSDPPPIFVLTSADGVFTGTRTGGEARLTLFGPQHFGFMTFAAPSGSQLSPGEYDGATRWPFQAPNVPGLEVSFDGSGCNTLTGRFVIFEIESDATGKLQRFAADFEQHCEDEVTPFYGSIRFQSSVPIQRPCGDEDRDGKADATDRCPGTVIGEQINEAGCSVAQFCASFSVTGAVGRRACPVANWLNDGRGYLRGDCMVLLDSSGKPTACVPRPPASRPDAVLKLQSDPGDPFGYSIIGRDGFTRTLTRANGGFDARGSSANGVASLNFSGGPGGVEFWSVTFAAPHGLSLIPGSYEGATSLFPAPAAGTPGLDVEGDGSACSTVTGRFEIQNVAFGYGTRVDALDATFEQHCDGAVPALRGSIHYVRPVRHGLTCLDQDGDGEPDATDLCPATPPGAAVDDGGCSLSQFCESIDLANCASVWVLERGLARRLAPASSAGLPR